MQSFYTNGIQTDTNGIQTDTNGIQTDTNPYTNVVCTQICMQIESCLEFQGNTSIRRYVIFLEF